MIIVTLIQLFQFAPCEALTLLWSHLPKETVARHCANFPALFLEGAFIMPILKRGESGETTFERLSWAVDAFSFDSDSEFSAWMDFCEEVVKIDRPD